MAKTLYFVAGEASGDEHGAALLRALRDLTPDWNFAGRGGPLMKQIAGGDFFDWTDAAAVVGLWEVVKRYGFFREQFRLTLREIDRLRPDAVVLIDYPGFNLRLARTLRKRSTTPKIIYYISPQVWAWNRGRIRQMARYLDLMLCIFPFEAGLYNQSGLRTIFVGHPMIGNLAARRTAEPRQPNLIGLFPGSRFREVRKIFPVMLEAARQISARQPAARFEVAAASPTLGTEMERVLSTSGFSPERMRVVTGDTAGIMQRAFVGIIASGTATLEAAYFRLPFVLVYKVSWLTYLVARLVIKTPYLGMPNVLAGREVVPEFIQHRAHPRAISQAVLELLNEPAKRALIIREFDSIVNNLGESGASEKAARAIIEEVGL